MFFYSFRLYYYVFFDFKKASKYVYISSSSYILNSTHYSNTTIASNLAIFGIFTLAYVLSFYFYCFVLNNSYLPVDVVISTNVQYTKNIVHDFGFLWNLSFFNLLVIICFIGVCWSQWRRNFTFHQLLNNYFNLLTTVLFIFIVLIILL